MKNLILNLIAYTIIFTLSELKAEYIIFLAIIELIDYVDWRLQASNLACSCIKVLILVIINIAASNKYYLKEK
jgi:hypothetical protein